MPATRTWSPGVTSIVLLPAIVVLVSGSVGFQGLAAIAEGDAETVRSLLPETLSVIDVGWRKGVIHRNAAARYKSRLTQQRKHVQVSDRLNHQELFRLVPIDCARLQYCRGPRVR